MSSTIFVLTVERYTGQFVPVVACRDRQKLAKATSGVIKHINEQSKVSKEWLDESHIYEINIIE